MNGRIFETGLALATLAFGIGTACGGKVVFDGMPSEKAGSGGTSSASGHGGATSSPASVGQEGPGPVVGTTGPSTASGPICDCTTVCDKIKMCGFPINNCLQLCGGLPDDLVNCVCNSDCGTIPSCLSGNTGGTGGTSGPTASSGSGDPQACQNCSTNAAMGKCGSQLMSCLGNNDCSTILQCEQMCGFGPQCKQQCDDKFPGGQMLFDNLMVCAVCQSCSMECNGLPVESYCGM